MTIFNHSYANRILHELEKHNRLRFNELYHKTRAPRNTFVSTLNKLKHANQVGNEITVRNGKVVSEYFLTDEFKLKRIWGIDERITTKRDGKSFSFYNKKGQLDCNKERKKYLLLLTLFKAVFGSAYQYVTSDPKRHPITLSSYMEEGISQQDLVAQDVMGMNGAFLHLGFTEAEVQQCFEQLKRHYPPILKPRVKKVPNFKAKGDYDEHTRRFVIPEKSLRNLLEDAYAGIFPKTMFRMKDTWLYLQDPEQASSETNWYRSLFGKGNVESLIKRVIDTRNELDRKHDEEKGAIKAVIIDRIKMYDGVISEYYKKIMSKRNDSIRKRYSEVIDPVLDIVYPQFLRDLHKNNKI